eukprot:4897948-Alexandrium_andersonii.AAC.1
MAQRHPAQSLLAGRGVSAQRSLLGRVRQQLRHRSSRRGRPRRRLWSARLRPPCRRQSPSQRGGRRGRGN